MSRPRSLQPRPWSVALGLALLAAGAPAAPHAVPQRLDLKTCLSLSARHNPGVLAAQARIREAIAGTRARKADLIPDVVLQDRHTKTTREFPAFFSRPDYTHEVMAKASQRVYSGGVLPAGVRAAQAQVREARARYHQTLDAVLSRVAKAYLQLHEQVRTQTVLAESLKTRQQRLAEITARVDAGVMLETARLQEEIQILEDERALLVSRTSERLARDTLHVLLDLPDEARPEHPEDLAPLDALTGQDAPTRTDLTHSARLAAVEARVAQAKARLAAARGAFKPAVDVQVTQFHVANGLSVFSADPNYTEAVGVVDVPVFDGGKRRADRDAAHKAVAASRLEAEAEREDLEIQVGQALLGIDEARARQRSSETRITLATRNRSIVQERYLQGAAVQSELLDADVAHRRARLDEVKSRFDLLRNFVDLLETTGRLTGVALAHEDLGDHPELRRRVEAIREDSE